MLKRIMGILFACAFAVMPVCSAENWVLFDHKAGMDLYIDFDTTWYDGTCGGFSSKLVVNQGNSFAPEGFAMIADEKFKDYSNGVADQAGVKRYYLPSGKLIKEEYDGRTKFYKKGTNMWRMCMMVKRHCGY